VTPAEQAHLRADLAEALHRREELHYRWAVAEYTSSSTDDPAALDVELLRVEATILELQKTLAEATATAETPPAPAGRLAIDLASPPANDTPAALPELLTAREAAEFLRLSTDTLERLRAAGEGPPWQRVGRRILYPLSVLREHGRRK
jgi:hypothetical protein